MPPEESTADATAEWTAAASRWFWIVTGLLAAVIVAVGLRASLQGWLPTADDAFLALRSRHVLSTHPPLLSTASSGGALGSETFNHPGPLALYLAAPLLALFGAGAMPFACALINAGAVVATAAVLRRNARATLAACVLAAVAVLVWSMGSGLLGDVWNPHLAILPYLTAIVATWAVVRGDAPALPVAVLAVSLAAQTHLSFSAMSLPVLAVLVAATGAHLWSDRSESPPRRWWRWTGVAVGVGVLSALPPLVEQLSNGSDGNLARLLRNSGLDADPVGLRRAAAVTVQKLVAPPFFGRGGWEEPVHGPTFLRGVPLAVGAVVVVGVLAATILTAHRRGDRQVRDLAALVSLLLAVGVVVTARLPTFLLGLRLSNIRWLWPLAAVTWGVCVVRPAELLATATLRTDEATTWVWRGALGVTAAFALMTFPAHNEDISGSLPSDQALFAGLWEQAGGRLSGLDSVELRGGNAGRQLFVVPALIQALDEAGVEVGLTDPIQLQQAGDSLRSSGEEEWILTVTGADEPAPSTDAVRLATVEPPAAADRERIESRVRELAESISEDDLEPGPGLSGAEREELFDATVAAFVEDPVALLSSNLFSGQLRTGLVRVRGQDSSDLADLALAASSIPADSMTLWLEPRNG